MRSDPQLIDTLHLRAKIINAIRKFFEQDGFIEVTTPSLVKSPDPAIYLDSFSTRFTTPAGVDLCLYLPTSPEHHMKRMVAAGMQRIYQLGPFFRNGELDDTHNPDFIGLEWYQVGASIDDLMSWIESLVMYLAQNILGTPKIVRNGNEVDLRPPFVRMSMREAFRSLADIEIPGAWSLETLHAASNAAGIKTAHDDSFDDIIHRIMLERVDTALSRIGPVFLYGYPAAMAAQARSNPLVADEAERFELFAGGLELCNGYRELTDSIELRKRFTLQLEMRKSLGKPVFTLDEAYLHALQKGMPDCSGCALGVDRLMMLLCGKDRIADVMAFPLSLEMTACRDETHPDTKEQ